MIWDPQIYKGAMSHDQATRQQAILPKAPTGGEDARLSHGCAMAPKSILCSRRMMANPFLLLNLTEELALTEGS